MKDTVAIVTGAASGIGKATTQALADEGASVVLADLNLEKAEEVAEEIKAKDGETLCVKVNVADENDVQKMVEVTLDRFDRVDILVNNAGLNCTTSVEDMTKQEWDRVFDIQLWGVFTGCRAVMKKMQEQKYGRIVNISSVVGKIGGIYTGMNYSVSKAGVICVTKNFAKILAPYQVTVNAICPGPINTPFHNVTTKEQREFIIKGIPLGRFGEAEDIAQAVVFLASDKAKFITGEILDVNGGILMD